MAQAIVDPEQLRQFATMLRRFNETLTQAAGTLNQEMQRLSTSWRDQEHEKFTVQFEEELKQVGRLIESGERHIPYLLRKAELIEEYQRHG